MSARGFLGAGDVYLATITGGVAGNYEGPFECNKFEIKPNVTLKEAKSKGKTSYGQVIETVALQEPADFTMVLTEVNRATLAIALLGTEAAVSQTAGTMTDEALVAKLDKWVPLSKFALTAGTVVVTHTSGAPTYVEGTDYIVNYDLGWIKALSTGAIVADQSLKVDSTYKTVTGTDIRGATQAQVRVRVKFDGKNYADNLPTQVTVYELVIAADSAFDFLSDDFAEVTLPGRMKTPTGFTEPFLVRLLNS